MTLSECQEVRVCAAAVMEDWWDQSCCKLTFETKNSWNGHNFSRKVHVGNIRWRIRCCPRGIELKYLVKRIQHALYFRSRSCFDNRHRQVHNWPACMGRWSSSRSDSIHRWNTFCSRRLGWHCAGWLQWEERWLRLGQTVLPMWVETRNFLETHATHAGTVGGRWDVFVKQQHAICYITSTIGCHQSNIQRSQYRQQSNFKLVKLVDIDDGFHLILNFSSKKRTSPSVTGSSFHREWAVVLAFCNTLVKHNSLQAIGVAFNWTNQLERMMELLMMSGMLSSSSSFAVNLISFRVFVFL